MTPDRREFLRQVALGAAIVGGAATADASAAQSSGQGVPRRAPKVELDRRMIEALADAVLPESLGESGRRDAARAFLVWARDYPAGVEEMHGYGYAEITLTPEGPSPRWVAQLEVLDRRALRLEDKASRRFADLTVAERREVISQVLMRVTGPRLPSSPLAAQHVAIALMAHWASTPEAVNLAYNARIDRAACGRPLAESPRAPLPLAPERG
jgi:hypothetical protein